MPSLSFKGSEPLAAALPQALRALSRSCASARRDAAACPAAGNVRRLRTAARRLAAACALVRGLLPRGALRVPRRGLRRLLRSLGGLRDLDAALAWIEAAPPDPSLGLCAADLAARRRRQAARLKCRMARGSGPDPGGATGFAANHLAGLGDDELSQGLARELGRLLARVARARERAASGDPGRRHRLRIAFRRLRYAAEVLGPALEAFTDADLEAMHRCHALLGRLQDLRVARRAVARFGRSRNPVVRAELAPVLEAIDAERARLLPGIAPALDSALAYWQVRLAAST
ncbi:MAG: CHAD domain-containing protein [Candidatus Edwardsbacteria bacterium]|jgi:CHAD domain-containing protein|nr:CHAD domain-containing protein [Candidatus Edwardsbacteria bacterium]